MGSIPDSLDELSRVCIECGDHVDDRWLDDDRCVGCRYGGVDCAE